MVGDVCTEFDLARSTGSVDPETGGVLPKPAPRLLELGCGAGLSTFIGIGDLPGGEATGDAGVWEVGGRDVSRKPLLTISVILSK